MIQGFMVVGTDKHNRLISTDVFASQILALGSAKDIGILPKYSRVIYITVEIPTVEIRTVPVTHVEIK